MARRKEDDFDRERREYRERRERAIALMVSTPAFLRLEMRKDKALRAWTIAEDMARVTRRPSDVEVWHRAEANAKRAMRAVYRYETAFLAKHGVSW